jgi:hypothetical protein
MVEDHDLTAEKSTTKPQNIKHSYFRFSRACALN